jgi:endo-1,4-beta-D-glucanase Y
MKNIAIFIILFFLIGDCLLSRARPFPQNVDYPNGYQTSVISASDIQTAYDRWKDLYLGSCSGTYRVLFEDTARTVSEGMGYGMLLTAYFGEKGKFDSLFAFYRSKRTPKAYNLMAWNVTCDSIIDPGSATDGDLDVAFALIVAYYQWGEDYLDKAKKVISILKEHYFDTCGGIYTIKPGGHWGGCDLTNISYYTPAYFRVFADETNDAFWDTVADHTYTILENGADDNTGLVPDWQSYDGVPGGDPPLRIDYYRYDACRVPWRIALDYLWNGNEKALNWCERITNFADSIGPYDIVDGYDLDGTPRGQYNNSPFVGGFAIASMCKSQSVVDDFSLWLLYLDAVEYDNQYFNLSLRCLYMLVLTGNFWKPGIANVDVR